MCPIKCLDMFFIIIKITKLFTYSRLDDANQRHGKDIERPAVIIGLL